MRKVKLIGYIYDVLYPLHAPGPNLHENIDERALTYEVLYPLHAPDLITRNRSIRQH